MKEAMKDLPDKLLENLSGVAEFAGKSGDFQTLM
jgi:hypothetical protein